MHTNRAAVQNFPIRQTHIDDHVPCAITSRQIKVEALLSRAVHMLGDVRPVIHSQGLSRATTINIKSDFYRFEWLIRIKGPAIGFTISNCVKLSEESQISVLASSVLIKSYYSPPMR